MNKIIMTNNISVIHHFFKAGMEDSLLRCCGKTEADRVVAAIRPAPFSAECGLAGAHVGVP